MISGGAGILGAGASLFGASEQSDAAEQAAQQQSQAAMMSLMVQQQMFGQAKRALKPYYQAGQNALDPLQKLLTPGSATKELEQLPGFKFQSTWGNLQAQNALAAQGLGGSAGPLGKALSDYNQGLAGTYYMNSVNALQNFANMGSGAASALAGDAITSGGQQGQSLTAAGNAMASGTLGSANAITNGLNGVANSAMSAAYLGGIYGKH